MNELTGRSALAVQRLADAFASYEKAGASPARRVHGSVLALVLTFTGLLGAVSVTEPAQAEPLATGGAIVSVTQTYTRGDQGPRTWTTRSAEVTGSPGGSVDVVWDQYYSLRFDTDARRPLQVGVFADTSDASDGSGRAAFSVSGNYPFESRHGEFTVLDLAFDPSGRVTRLHIVFLTSTTDSEVAAFGEVRLNEPEPSVVSPSALSLRWPLLRRREAPLPVRETLTNTSATSARLGKAVVKGGAKSDFTVGRDGCSHRTLAPRKSCTVDVAFSARQGGPRVATLVVPAGRREVTVALGGSGQIGSSKMTVTGSYPGRKQVYQRLWPDPRDGFGPDRAAVLWFSRPGSERPPLGMSLELRTPRPATIGVHPTNEYGHETAYGFDLMLGYSCGNDRGTIDIKGNQTDRHAIPTYADIDFTQVCNRAAYKGTLLWQARKDRRPPHRPTKLSVSGNTIRWKRSSSSDYASTIVRVLPSTDTRDASPANGYAVSSGTKPSAKLPRLRRGQTYTLLAFSVDKTGNVSSPAKKTFTA